MSNSLPQREGGLNLLPVIRLHEDLHRDDVILKSAEIAQTEGASGIFVVDAKRKPNTRYIDRVIKLLQHNFPELFVGVSYPQYKGALQTIHQVRGRLLLDEYEREPMLWVDEPLGGTSAEMQLDELELLIKSPDLASATVPIMFGSVALGGEVVVPAFLDIAVAGRVKAPRPVLKSDVDTLTQQVDVPIAVAGITSREQLFIYDDADFLLVTSGLESMEPGLISRQRLAGFVITADKIREQKAQESAGSVA